MVKSTHIARIDGIPLTATVDGDHAEAELSEVKSQVKLIFRRFTSTSEPRASIESGPFTIHYMIQENICYLCICERSYPRKLAFSYLQDIATEFANSYQNEAMAPGLRPYAFVQFDTFMQQTTKEYQDTRATANLDKLQDDLKDVTKVMTKNIEDLLVRGDSLEKMGDMSGRLRNESRKYKKAAVRVNFEYMMKKYGLIGSFVMVMLGLIWWRFF